MSRPHVRPIQQTQQHSYWTVKGNRVVDAADSNKRKPALVVGAEDASTVWLVLLRVLHVVEAIAIRFPHINQRAGERVTFGVGHGAMDEHGFPDGSLRRNGLAILEFVRVVVERSQH